jgi:hypothetical protein
LAPHLICSPREFFASAIPITVAVLIATREGVGMLGTSKKEAGEDGHLNESKVFNARLDFQICWKAWLPH